MVKEEDAASWDVSHHRVIGTKETLRSAFLFYCIILFLR